MASRVGDDGEGFRVRDRIRDRQAYGLRPEQIVQIQLPIGFNGSLGARGTAGDSPNESASEILRPNSSRANASGNADCPCHQRMGINVRPGGGGGKLAIAMAMDSAMRIRTDSPPDG